MAAYRADASDRASVEQCVLSEELISVVCAQGGGGRKARALLREAVNLSVPPSGRLSRNAGSVRK